MWAFHQPIFKNDIGLQHIRFPHDDSTKLFWTFSRSIDGLPWFFFLVCKKAYGLDKYKQVINVTDTTIIYRVHPVYTNIVACIIACTNIIVFIINYIIVNFKLILSSLLIRKLGWCTHKSLYGGFVELGP